MIYGPAAYAEHAGMVVEKLDPKQERYGWREHVLFWRLDALSLVRAYAILYLQEISEMLPPASREHIQVAVESYWELLGMLVSDNISESRPIRVGSCEINVSQPHVGVLFGTDSEGLPSCLFWCEGEKRIPVSKLFESVEGRQQFADWLLKIGELEEKAISAIEKAIAAAAA
jgi:hypothetical protein